MRMHRSLRSVQRGKGAKDQAETLRRRSSTGQEAQQAEGTGDHVALTLPHATPGNKKDQAVTL
jgi:hypothetical protein